MCIIPFKFHSTLGGKFSYYKGGNWGTSNPNNLPKATELERVGLTPSSLRSVSAHFLPALQLPTLKQLNTLSQKASGLVPEQSSTLGSDASSLPQRTRVLLACSVALALPTAPSCFWASRHLAQPWLSLHSADRSCRETSPGPGLCPCLCSLYSLLHHRC